MWRSSGLQRFRFDVQTCGDSALLVTAHGPELDKKWRDVQSLAAWLEAQRIAGVYAVVPTFDSLVVEYDCTVVRRDTVESAMRSYVSSADAPISGRCFAIPVVYGGDAGPDLDTVSTELGLDAQEVVRRHQRGRHVIRCIGPNGMPMIDGLDFGNGVRRSSSPRTRILAGTIALAGTQAVIYTTPSPGGWRLIGRTPLTLIDISRPSPIAYRPGDKVSFFSITMDAFDRLMGTSVVECRCT